MLKNKRTLMTRVQDRLRLLWRRYWMRDFYSATPETPNAVIRALKKTQNLSGDYYEFGLYKGYSFYKALKYCPDITGHGFDSFEGLPANEEGGKFDEGRYSCSLKQVEGDLKKRGVNNYIMYKGFYEDTLTPVLAKKLPNARVVLIDSDLYSSAKKVLDFITPRLQNGTYLMFDDWNCFNADDNQGERRACREWLDKNKSIKLHKEYNFGWHGIAFRVEVMS